MTDIATLQLRPLGSGAGYYCRGDVVIAASAVIAPGVLLEADPGARIVIAEGVCLGMGVLIHAQGTDRIAIASGAHIGAGVVITGAVTIGAQAVVGAVSTICGQDVAAGAVLAAGSMLYSQVSAAPPLHARSAPESAAPVQTEPTTAAEPELPPNSESNDPPSLPSTNGTGAGTQITKPLTHTQSYGKLQVQRLKHSLFRQSP